MVIFHSHGSFRGGYIFPLKRIGHHVHTYMPHVSPPYETVVPFFDLAFGNVQVGGRPLLLGFGYGGKT